MRFAVLAVTFVAIAATLHSTDGQVVEDKPLGFDAIVRTLTTRKPTLRSNKKLNRRLASKIGRLKVNFILSADEEKTLRGLLANDELITAIRQNLADAELKRLIAIKDMEGLYSLFVNNFQGRTRGEISIALASGREFIRRYADNSEVKEHVAYIRVWIPTLENKL